ncbi:MAG: adenylate/guanylate cyclase domain-containing response regulator [Deltaproteobacteria bacterium]|nr:adenylate/guanylate cyclase domain-containing response regulator [Deltaproteobacteria bacterium]
MNGLLVVDDEEGVRRSLKRLLEKDGYAIVLAENGREALDIIKNDAQGIETVICDYRMPGIDGIETLIEIGRMNPEVTRIILTAYATMANAIEAVNAGIDGFLTKPFVNQELRAKVRECSIKKRLKQFVSGQVMAEIQKNSRTIHPRRMEVTILFSDMRGFSGLSERLTPAELSEFVNRYYFTPLDRVIFSRNGTLDKHIGDSVMAIFGAPVGGGDDALRAVQVAIAILEEIALTNMNIPQTDRKIAVGIGIATGEVLAGIFGSSWKKEYTAYGATVNLAKRLEKIAGTDQIVVCERTARLVEDVVRLEKISGPIVRGVPHPPEVFRVLGRK